MSRSRYTWHDNGFLVVIIDRNITGKSVTNDIENVIRDLAILGVPVDDRRIIYQDSDGTWDGVATYEQEFMRFVPIGTCDMGLAIAAAIKAYRWP